MKRALGKGLNALLPSPSPADEQAVYNIDINKVEPNPDQPRKNFDGDALRQLADSIAAVGIVQPIIVSDEGAYYRIIAGERRWRAARIAGLNAVPAIVRNFSRDQTVEVALIENLQRQDLNPIEEAQGYERLISEYGYTQDRLARSLGRSRPAIANAVRLLKLPERVRDMISAGSLSPGHARALLALNSGARAETLAGRVVERGLNVRQAEALVNAELRSSPSQAGDASTADMSADDEMMPVVSELTTAGECATADVFAADAGEVPGSMTDIARDAARNAAREAVQNAYDTAHDAAYDAALSSIEDALRSRFNTRVALSRAKTGTSGRIIIEYYGDEDLQRLLDQWGIKKV